MSLQSVPAADDPPGADTRHWLSAAVDGDRESIGKACLAWRDDAQARAQWHAYHLIGDVMRSGELAAPAGRDAAFLARVRQQLAAEPVVLAPAAAPTSRRRAQGWLLPAAVAAGFVVVAGVLVVSRVSAPAADGAAQTLASAAVPSGVMNVGNGAAVPSAPAAAGTLMRDPRLDEFLRLHQSAKGGFAAAVPGSSLRRVDAEIAPGAPR